MSAEQNTQTSSPPRVSDRMRELVQRYHETVYEVGRFGEDPNHPPRRSWRAVTAERTAAESALLGAIAALETERDHYARQTDELFKRTPEYADAIQEMRAVLHKYGFRVEDSDVK